MVFKNTVNPLLMLRDYPLWVYIGLNRPKYSRTAIQLFQHAIHCRLWQTFTPGFIWRINEKICQLSYLFHLSCCLCNAKTKYQRFEANISKKGIAQFPHSCFCERFIFSYGLSAYSAAGKYVDRSWKYINRSQTHEMWKLGLRPRSSFSGNT